ncbi:MAG TPA: ABC transporter permease [Vicinamibacterales bacterium]|nr:ABC transporter permease [Vicinamibacterales bacterium]
MPSLRGFLERGSRLALRLAPPEFRNQWHRDVLLTFRETCLAAEERDGAFGLARNGVAELFDLIRAALRARTGRVLPITGGVTPRNPNDPRPTMSPFLDDLRNSWRKLIRQPRAVTGTILLLALAIGVTSAMFAVVDAFLVRPAPFRDPDTLAQLWVKNTSGSDRMDFATARAWRDSGVFEAVHPVVINAMAEFQGASGIETRPGARVPPGLFATLGIAPLMGREFVAGEGREGNEGLVILSSPAWRELYAADPGIVGKTVEINKRPVIVVGVMPDGFRFPHRGNGIWWPLDPDAPSAAAGKSQMLVFARRRASMPVAEAERLAKPVVASLLGDTASTQVKPMGAGLMDDYSRESIQALGVGVGLVFLLLCANVTNLIMARTTARRQEFGVCSALGASRSRLLRQVFLENVAMGVCATILGLGLAYALVALAQRTLPEDLLWRTLNPLDVDFRTVAATSAAGMLAVLLAGLPSAWFGTRADANEALQQSSRGGTDTPTSRRLTRALLVIEVAMAVALLASAGLQVRSFVNLTTADRGLDSDRVLIAKFTAPATTPPDPASQAVMATLVEDRIRSLPGIEGVTRASNIPPDTGAIHFAFDVQTTAPRASPIRVELMRSYYVAPKFFEIFGIALLQGRGFEPADDPGAAVLSETLARKLFSDGSAVGQTFSFGKQTYHVVGVAREIRNSLTDPRQDAPEFYSPWYRVRTPGSAPAAPASSNLTFGIRCADPCASQESIRTAVEQVSAAVKTTAIYPLSRDFMEQLSRPRVAAVIAALFAGLALFATAAGLYGVLAYVVSRRRREFGIRAALGAEPSALRLAVIGDGLRVTAVGVLVGVAAGWALSRWLASVQFGVTFFDPATWLAVIATVAVIALIASWRPATSAMRVDPSEMLREP